MEVFLIVFSLDLVVVHREQSVLFLVWLEYHTDEESSCNSEQHLLGNPHENDESEEDEQEQVGVLQS